MKAVSIPPHRHGAMEPVCDISATSGAPMDERPHIVVIGAGFGGLSLVKKLADAPVRITLIDRRNHHLFQPLLYQVATAGLSPADIATPIRSIFREQKNVTTLLGEVIGVDRERQEVVLSSERILYDHLVIATGALPSYFGHDEWKQTAPGLKSLEDATEVRRRILLAFERAEVECNPAERARLLTFAVVGGGPTGVELAGAIAEIARQALTSDFRNIDPASARVVLVDSGDRVLRSFPPSLSARAQKALDNLGVELRQGEAVTACDADGIVLKTDRIAARTVIWAAGVRATPAARWLGTQGDRLGRVVVDQQLSVPGASNVFVIGDAAAFETKQGATLPGLAPVAKQQGEFLARLLRARARGRKFKAKFAYRDFGNLATIGRTAAVADFGFIRFSGFIAWLLWCVAHIYFLVGGRNRLVVGATWLWAYATFQRGARLILHGEGASTASVTNMSDGDVATRAA